MNNSKQIKKLVVISILTAIIIVLQLLGNLFTFANGMALSLVPIAVGAILYGPLTGAFLGLVMALIVLTQPANYMFASSLVEGEETLSVFKVILLILIKTTLAGFISGLCFKFFYPLIKKQKTLARKNTLLAVAIGVSSILLPVINTSSCAFMLLAFFGFTNETIKGMVITFFTLNFIIEMIIAFVTTPVIVFLMKTITRKQNFGFKYDFNFSEELL